MITHLLDTSVYCQPLKKHPVPSVMARWNALGDEALCISMFCETEVLQGLEMKQSEHLWQAYREILQDRLPILVFDLPVARKYAALQAECIRQGLTRPVFDLLIAATAIVHHVIVATCNARDFKPIPGIQVEDWSLPIETSDDLHAEPEQQATPGDESPTQLTLPAEG